MYFREELKVRIWGRGLSPRVLLHYTIIMDSSHSDFPGTHPPGIFWYIPMKKGGLIASILHNEETQDFGSTVLGLLQPNFLEFQFALSSSMLKVERGPPILLQ